MSVIKGFEKSFELNAVMSNNSDGIHVNKEEITKHYKIAIEENCITTFYKYVYILEICDGIPAYNESNTDGMFLYSEMTNKEDGILKNIEELHRQLKMLVDKANEKIM